MGFVLDASVALAWCFADETTLASMTLLERLETESATVPGIWSLEVGNILVAAERKGRISYAKMSEFLSLIDNLNIQTDTETHKRGFHEIRTLAHSEKLTTYDSAYLELAMCLGLTLATKDKQLLHIAKKLGVSVIAI